MGKVRIREGSWLLKGPWPGKGQNLEKKTV